VNEFSVWCDNLTVPFIAFHCGVFCQFSRLEDSSSLENVGFYALWLFSLFFRLEESFNQVNKGLRSQLHISSFLLIIEKSLIMKNKDPVLQSVFLHYPRLEDSFSPKNRCFRAPWRIFYVTQTGIKVNSEELAFDGYHCFGLVYNCVLHFICIE